MVLDFQEMEIKRNLTRRLSALFQQKSLAKAFLDKGMVMSNQEEMAFKLL